MLRFVASGLSAAPFFNSETLENIQQKLRGRWAVSNGSNSVMMCNNNGWVKRQNMKREEWNNSLNFSGAQTMTHSFSWSKRKLRIFCVSKRLSLFKCKHLLDPPGRPRTAQKFSLRYFTRNDFYLPDCQTSLHQYSLTGTSAINNSRIPIQKSLKRASIW